MKNKKLTIFLLVGILVIIFATFTIFMYFNFIKKESTPILLKTISSSKANINKYTVYGTHLNIFGSLNLKDNNNCKVKFVTLDKTGNEEIIDINYTMQDGYIKFSTSEYINKGIDLEKINSNNYVFYIKITDNISGLSTYYPLENSTNYGDLEYYSLTKNKSNNYIKIFWDENGLNISCTPCTLPEDVYDIVIDEGHGGESTGAIHNGYKESDINYDLGIMLKENLENLGLKVLSTRSSKDETVGNYNENGRAVIPNKVKAKYCFSIHNNSSIYEDSSGVEVYAPNFADLTFAKSIADNIVSMASSTYSRNTEGFVSNGVYVLKFSEETINECIKEAKEGGYEPYEMSLETNMFFMIREVGGICTGAYMDGRDIKNGTNPYYNSNITAESYLLEIGYVSNKEDIENVITNMDKYVNAIVKSIKTHLEL